MLCPVLVEVQEEAAEASAEAPAAVVSVAVPEAETSAEVRVPEVWAEARAREVWAVPITEALAARVTVPFSEVGVGAVRITEAEEDASAR